MRFGPVKISSMNPSSYVVNNCFCYDIGSGCSIVAELAIEDLALYIGFANSSRSSTSTWKSNTGPSLTASLLVLVFSRYLATVVMFFFLEFFGFSLIRVTLVVTEMAPIVIWLSDRHTLLSNTCGRRWICVMNDPSVLLNWILCGNWCMKRRCCVHFPYWSVEWSKIFVYLEWSMIWAVASNFKVGLTYIMSLEFEQLRIPCFALVHGEAFPSFWARRTGKICSLCDCNKHLRQSTIVWLLVEYAAIHFVEADYANCIGFHCRTCVTFGIPALQILLMHAWLMLYSSWLL